MAQQLNLINPDLRKKRDLLTAIPLLIASGILLAVLLGAFSVAFQQANAVQKEADKRDAEVKALQAQVQELAKQVAENKPSPRLAEELEHARTLLDLREEIIAILEGGVFGKNGGFSEFMRGFARQVPRDLWLTGFSLHSSDESIEIRGSMLKPVSLPDFIHRLGNEAAFQGVGFSSLTMDRPVKVADPKQPEPAASSDDQKSKMAPFVDFVMKSKPKDAKAGAKP